MITFSQFIAEVQVFTDLESRWSGGNNPAVVPVYLVKRASQFKTLLAKFHNDMRGFLNKDGTMHVWDANYALHQDYVDHMEKVYPGYHFGHAFSAKEIRNLIFFNGAGKYGRLVDRPMLSNNPHLEAMFPGYRVQDEY